MSLLPMLNDRTILDLERHCLIGIIEHDHQIGRTIVEVMRILGHSLLTTDEIDDLLKPIRMETKKVDDGQLYFDFQYD